MRFVVVEIPDNEEADAFIEAIQSGYVMYSKPHPTLEGEVSINKAQTEWKVPAIYGVPTLFCNCEPFDNKKARTKKMGWWVHTKCSRPRPGEMLHPINLVEGDQDPRYQIYYIGFRADRRPWRIKE